MPALPRKTGSFTVIRANSAICRFEIEALRLHVMAAIKLHADGTPISLLALGNGGTKTGAFGF
jgi:hypothetical protein